MVRDAVAHSFNEDGPSAIFQGHSTGFFGHFADGEDVVSVDADCVDAVSDSSAGDAVASILFEGWGRDGVAVVAADEDYGAGSCGCDVEGGMEVAFACGTFAEVAGNDPLWDVGVL